MREFLLISVVLVLAATWAPRSGAVDPASSLYRKASGIETRWFSFENPTGAKGEGAKRNKGAKGAAFEFMKAGETKVLCDYAGSGTIRRIWMTMRPSTPEVLRSLRLDMYWDGSAKPAVSAPLGDFFCWVLGQPKAFENELFANPEARSFVSYVPMPFRSHAKITVTNESKVDLSHLFYDVDATIGDPHGDDMLYFHAYWRRERPTTLGKDFEILPRVEGAGRFLGCNVGVIANKENLGWWGEGEVKMYLDGDTEFPTVVGTGVEDYIATAWGQGEYAQRYHGCLMADEDKGWYSFYRLHIPDPVYFQKDFRITIQQLGGTMKADVVKMVREGVPVQPVSINNNTDFIRLLEMGEKVNLEDPTLPDGWVNYFRRDDYCATAYFYLDKPESGLPPLAAVAERTSGIGGAQPSSNVVTP